MKTELPLDRESLRSQIAKEYGLRPGPLEFLPKGEVACAYLFFVPEGKRYLLKIFTASRMAEITVQRMGIWLPLCWELRNQGWLREIAAPVKTLAGGLSMEFQSKKAALFEYIEGEVLDRKELWTDSVIKSAGELLGKIHAQSSRVNHLLGTGEDFGLPFAEDLKASLEALGPGADARLRDAVLPKKEWLLQQLSKLANRGRALPRAEIPQGLVHTDLHGSNMVLRSDGLLHALDWEGARLAPFEHDFFSWHESPDFSAFMEGYSRVRPPPVLSKGTLEFYGFRRRLEDITDWLSRLLREDISAEQRENDLKGLSEDLAVLAQL